MVGAVGKRDSETLPCLDAFTHSYRHDDGDSQPFCYDHAYHHHADPNPITRADPNPIIRADKNPHANRHTNTSQHTIAPAEL
jgi:hypothetical protein